MELRGVLSILHWAHFTVRRIISDSTQIMALILAFLQDVDVLAARDIVGIEVLVLKVGCCGLHLLDHAYLVPWESIVHRKVNEPILVQR